MSRALAVPLSSGLLRSHKGTLLHPCKTHNRPHFPASCPWLLSVGATAFQANNTEVPAQWDRGGATGAGFSDFFNRLDFQSGVVDSYLANSVDKGDYSRFNTKGRAYPDVALIVTDYVYYFKDHYYLSSGTSNSAPMWAGMISLINDARISQGKPTLGFFNPRLYTDKAVQAAFTDIATGGNPSCNTNGFKAAAGWDVVTGWGVPNFENLKKVLSN
ncbi:hypothetical protein VHEMI06776 [[Torrubiella] hemipterigena]|uniref:Peptidase S53 domain-containing protein n=1 Tax=[Torrubiella] hemipterigena TaxID=1531966 RepID=A0A0A1TJX9_9HYPO|nr:hypothetical protein VHEMI06776 [[Torrubiella] hemipterigena]